MSMDLTVRLGDILTMVGLIGGGTVVVFTLRSSIQMLAQQMQTHDAKIAALDHKLDGITRIIAEQARHDERLTAHDERIRHIEEEIRMRRA